MSISFYLSPNKPKEGEDKGCFKINVDEYKSQLLKRWSGIEFYTPATEYVVLFWRMPYKHGVNGALHRLLDDYQTVAFGYSDLIAEFVHWHQGLVDSKCMLYLYHDVSFEPVEIRPGMSQQDIQSILDAI